MYITSTSKQRITPKSIAVFVKNLTSGGAEKQAVLLAKVLSTDHDVHFVVFNAAKTHQKYLDICLSMKMENITASEVAK